MKHGLRAQLERLAERVVGELELLGVARGGGELDEDLTMRS